MPLFACSVPECMAVENTALSNFWSDQMQAHKQQLAFHPLCSECDPRIGKWHGRFPKVRADNGEWEPDGPDREHFLRRVSHPVHVEQPLIQ